MKWIGQSIVDFIARFRSDVYLDSPTAGGSDPDKFLGIDSNNKIIYRTGTQVLDDIGGSSTTGDITAVVAGTGLTGGATSGSATLNVANLSITELHDDLVQTATEIGDSFGDNDTSLLTAAAVDDRILSYGYSTTTGDITGVTAGTNLTGGGTSGAVTLTLADASTSAKGAASFDSNHFVTSSGAVSLATAMTWADTTITTDTVTFTSTNTDDPQFIIKNTTADAQGARLQMRKDRGAAMVQGDRVGEIDFIGEDASQNQQQYSKIITKADVVTHGQESGKFQIQVASHDGQLEDGLVLAGGSVDAEVDVEIGKGAASVTTVAGDLTITGDTLSFDSQIGRRSCFQFKGYGTSDGTNYDLSEEISDSQAPFQHDHSTGSDGLTAQTTNTIIRSGGKVMPYAGVLKKFSGWATVAGSGILNIGIFKFTPVDNNNSNVSAVLLVNEQITGAGNTKMRSFSETSSFDAGFSAGDILYSAVKAEESSKTWFINSTLEVEWS